MSGTSGRGRASAVLTGILGVALLVSIVHYTDNYVAFERYPQLESGPNPTQTMILVGWFAFTAFGLAGYLLFRRGLRGPAAACLAVYSLSGLVGLGHYAAPEVDELAWWRHAHIVVDIICGVAVLTFAIWLAVTSQRRAEDVRR